MKMDDLEDEVEKKIMGYYSLYIQDTNVPKNQQACLVDPNKYPMGYLEYTSLVEYLIKAINFLRRILPNSEFFKYEESLPDISGAIFKKGCRRS